MKKEEADAVVAAVRQAMDDALANNDAVSFCTEAGMTRAESDGVATASINRTRTLTIEINGGAKDDGFVPAVVAGPSEL